MPEGDPGEQDGPDRQAVAARMPIGAIRRYPASCRSSSLSPPHRPYSWCWRAKSLQATRTAQLAHTERAIASRLSRAWGRSAVRGKNRCVNPRHAALSIQRLSLRWSIDEKSAAAITSPWLSPWNRGTPLSPFPKSSRTGNHSELSRSGRVLDDSTPRYPTGERLTLGLDLSTVNKNFGPHTRRCRRPATKVSMSCRVVSHAVIQRTWPSSGAQS